MCNRTGEIVRLADGKPIRCPSCFRNGWAQRRLDAPLKQGQATENERPSQARQPSNENEKSTDSLNYEDKEFLDALLSRLASQAKQPSEERKGGESRPAPLKSGAGGHQGGSGAPRRGGSPWLIWFIISVGITGAFILLGSLNTRDGTAPGSATEMTATEMTAAELIEFRAFALALINEDREAHGLPHVVLGSNPAAQLHAEDMLANDYMGHWWADGRKPYMVYTETGGTSYAHENAATHGWFSRQWTAKNCDSSLVACEVPTVRGAIRELQWGMMYDDAHADWGHRDNILGETHRAVNIGIAANGRRVAFVQHFEGGDVVANAPPILSPNGQLSFSVSKIAAGVDVAPIVSIFFDPPPTPKTRGQLDRLDSYCVGGGFTETCVEPVAVVLEPPGADFYYDSLQDNEVVADEWIETPGGFSFSASLGGLAAPSGVYTVVVWRATEVLVELSVTKDSTDRPDPTDSPSELDTVARIAEDWTAHPSPAPTGSPVTPAPKLTELRAGNPTETPTGTYTSDRAVLVALYNATAGAGWKNNTNWLSDAPIREWHGVTTDHSGRVIELDLKNNQLSGRIPSELSSLSDLENLNLGGNQLTGAIPSEIGDLSKLRALELWGNRLSGKIPTELGSLTNLQSLWIGNNQLSGEISPGLGSLSNLRVLELRGNQLRGNIPSELEGLTNLEWLWLGGTNQLTGCVPEGLRGVQGGDLSTLNLPFCTSAADGAFIPSGEHPPTPG